MVRLIYAGNLPDSATADELRTLFSQHGEVHTVVRPSSRETGRLHEFAFIHMENAQVAADALDGQGLDGFEIVVGTSNRRSQRSCSASLARAPIRSENRTSYGVNREDSMERTDLMRSMVERCRETILAQDRPAVDLPQPLQATHLIWMCDRLDADVDSWSPEKRSRWVAVHSMRHDCKPNDRS